MGRFWRLAVLLFIIMLLAACQYETLEEAIEKDIPFNVQKVVHKENIKDGTIVFYTTKQADGSDHFEALAAAFIKKNNKGWENAGHNHWKYEKNDQMMVYADTFYIYSSKGKLEARIPFIFGRIYSPDLKTVEAAGEDNKFIPVKTILHEKDRFFYMIGDYSIVRGLAGDGKEIIRQKK